jgi:hypothetical protein
VPLEPEEPDPAVQENGISILRGDEPVALLRRRFERPARLGSTVLTLVGAVTAAAGTAFWITSRSLVGVALPIFGSVLIVLGVAQFLLLRRDLEHWPDRAFLWDGGVELVLHNGEVRGVSWDDPDLRLTMVARPAPPPVVREFLLLWMSEGRIPAIELSEEGFTRVRQAAEDRRLNVTEKRRGRAAKITQWIEILPNRYLRPAPPTAASADAPSDAPAP